MGKNVKGIGGGTFNLVGAPNVIVLVLFVLALDDFEFILNTGFPAADSESEIVVAM